MSNVQPVFPGYTHPSARSRVGSSTSRSNPELYTILHSGMLVRTMEPNDVVRMCGKALGTVDRIRSRADQ